MADWIAVLLALAGLPLLGAWLEDPGLALVARLCRYFGRPVPWDPPWAEAREPDCREGLETGKKIPLAACYSTCEGPNKEDAA